MSAKRPEDISGNLAWNGGREQAVEFLLVLYLVEFQGPHRRISVEPGVGGHIPFPALYRGGPAQHIVETEDTGAGADSQNPLPSTHTDHGDVMAAYVGVGFGLLFRSAAAYRDVTSVTTVHCFHHGSEIWTVGCLVVLPGPVEIEMDHLMDESVFEFPLLHIVITAYREREMLGFRLLPRCKHLEFQIAETCLGVGDGQPYLREDAVEDGTVELVVFFRDELVCGSHRLL